MISVLWHWHTFWTNHWNYTERSGCKLDSVCLTHVPKTVDQLPAEGWSWRNVCGLSGVGWLDVQLGLKSCRDATRPKPQHRAGERERETNEANQQSTTRTHTIRTNFRNHTHTHTHKGRKAGTWESLTTALCIHSYLLEICSASQSTKSIISISVRHCWQTKTMKPNKTWALAKVALRPSHTGCIMNKWQENTNCSDVNNSDQNMNLQQKHRNTNMWKSFVSLLHCGASCFSLLRMDAVAAAGAGTKHRYRQTSSGYFSTCYIVLWLRLRFSHCWCCRWWTWRLFHTAIPVGPCLSSQSESSTWHSLSVWKKS